MEPDAGRPGLNPTPKPPPRPPVHSPLVPRPAGKGIRSRPTVIPPAKASGDGKPKLLPMDAPEPKRRFNRLGIILALAVGVGTIPFTYKFQKSRAVQGNKPSYKTDYDIPIEQRQWRMQGLVDNTEKQVIDRFGTPIISRNFNMTDGAFVGPLVGLKRFYAKTLPDYGARTAEKDDTVVWTAPYFQVIREVIWQFPDSYLTVWMREPRAVIDLTSDQGLTTVPAPPGDGGDWVVIDNFRVGKDLVKTPPAAAASPTP